MYFGLRKKIFGFDFATKAFLTINKSAVITLLKKYGSIIGKNCDIESTLLFHNCTSFNNLKIGNNCHIGESCFFDLRDKIHIGKNIVILMQSTFISHLDISKSELHKIYLSSKNSIFIKNNTYIGAHSKILKGVRLGHHSFVASGALVKKDVEPYRMVGGVSAKFIKKLNID